MLTSKERSALRSMANTLPAIFQVGKGGVTEELIAQLNDAIEAREIIKLTVLETADVTAREASDLLCEALRAEPVQTIGRKVVLYRKNREKPVIRF